MRRSRTLGRTAIWTQIAILKGAARSALRAPDEHTTPMLNLLRHTLIALCKILDKPIGDIATLNPESYDESRGH